ncbi:MAG: type II 3-dehydroquinate dehydratase [Pseudomonadota bacterium]
MHRKLLVLNGPNLNRLGLREPDTYGHTTLDMVHEAIGARASVHGFSVECRQSNFEGELVGWLQSAGEAFDGVIFNAGAYTHTSVALHDAARASGVPVIEVHISNVHAREAFRHHSYLAPVAHGVICGFGTDSYLLAVDGLVGHLERNADA